MRALAPLLSSLGRFPSPRVFQPWRHRSAAARSLCRDIQRDARQARDRVSHPLSFSSLPAGTTLSNATPKRRVRWKALSVYFVKKFLSFLTVCVYQYRFDISLMIYNALVLFNKRAQKLYMWMRQYAAYVRNLRERERETGTREAEYRINCGKPTQAHDNVKKATRDEEKMRNPR